ncbi:MAG: uracil-DNA glycosylase [Candidatus Thermoplasmatota archaeon]
MEKKILNENLEKNGINRSDVYITNIVKCHPPKNRAPYEDEIKKCSTYLQKQIELINPEIIATLGNFSTKTIFKFFGFKEEAISKLHGRIFSSPLHNIKIFPTFHPAACIYNPLLLEGFEKDIKRLAEILKK